MRSPHAAPENSPYLPQLEKASTATKDPAKTAKITILKLHRKRKGPAQIQYGGTMKGVVLKAIFEISYHGIVQAGGRDGLNQI